jgi:multidrug efflux system outer membrane protein
MTMPRMSFALRAAWLLSGMALLGGCALQGDRADRAVALPSAWQATPPASAAAGTVDADWWRGFGSTELDALIARAQVQSNDLAAAAARVAQADALARIAGAALRPQVTATLDAAREGRLGGRAAVDGSTHAAGFSARYELDLWGRDAAWRDQALHDLRASAFERDAVRLSVTANVASAWLLGQALRERAGIAQRNLDNARRVLALVESRSRAGAVSPLDLAQQRGLVAVQVRSVAALQQRARDAEAALAVLLGATSPVAAGQGLALDALQVPSIGAGAPSALLVRRPDIARAEAQLSAADANVLAARAALLPTVSLNASVGTGQGRFGRLFDNPVYSLAAGLAAPIFDGGRLAGGRQLAQARREELLAAYRGAIAAAFADAETALNAVSATDAQAAAQAVELAEARRAAGLSESRYRAGAETLLTLLDAQRTLYVAQDLSVQLRMARLQARVSLYRAMGGGWQARPCPTATATATAPTTAPTVEGSFECA